MIKPDHQLEKKTILLGSAGTGTAFAAACAIRREWNDAVKIVSMDTNPSYLVTTSLISDVFKQVKPFESENYINELIEIINNEKVNYYLPLMPEEFKIALKQKYNGCLSNELKILAPSLEMSELCADKLKLSESLKRIGVRVPVSSSVNNPFDAEIYFIKPKNGSGSIGARKILATELKEIPKTESDVYIIQEVCDQPEITVDAFYDDKESFCSIVCRERLAIKSGVSTKCRLYYDKATEQIARNIAKCVGLSGTFCFQMMKKREEWLVTDVNPRPGAGTSMCQVTGNDFFAATFALAFGENYKNYFNQLENEIIVTRQYSDFIMKYN